MAKKKLKIHSENILPIIKKWLYSDKDIFVRELVSNASDALKKVRTISQDKDLGIKDEDLKILVSVDKKAKTITFSDSGVGMTAEEVEKYIAQIAFSGAYEFAEKYKSDREEDQIIGHFGLGFFSAYMVAERVEIETLSFAQNAEPAYWESAGTSDYTLKKGSRKDRGTTITLHVNKDSEEYLDEAKIDKILSEHCAFLPFELKLGDKKINDTEPLWQKNPKECTEEDYLNFYRKLHPGEQDPLLWVHLNVDYPFHLKGILYFPKLKKSFDYSKNTIKLFCNRVFVSDNCKDLIPDYLMVLQGAIDSPDIPLNVSRSYLQMDSTVRQLASHISKKVADRLKSMHKEEAETFQKAWANFEVVLKLGAMQDVKFYDKIKPILIWKNTEDAWTTAEQYLERHNSEYEGRIYYAEEGKSEPHLLKLYQEKGLEVILAHPMIDTHFLSFLEQKLKEKYPKLSFQRIDAAVDTALEDKEAATTEANKNTEEVLIPLVKKHLNIEGLEVEAKNLSSDKLFGFVQIDENSRRFRDAYAQDAAGMDALFQGKKTYIVNANAPLAKKLPEIEKINPELCQKLTREMYELSLISQREMKPENIPAFLERTAALLQEMSSHIHPEKESAQT